jgi:trk system potassium uptake protein TrkA
MTAVSDPERATAATSFQRSLYIIIVGGGKVGFHLAKELVEANQEVLLIEQDPEKVAEIQEELGDIVMEGDGCEASVLEKAGTGRANMLLAVTGDDEDNLVSCQVAKARFNVERTVARINNPKNEEIFQKLEVDIVVSATSAIMSRIEPELPTHQLISLTKLKGSGLEIVEMRIPDDSRVLNRPVREIRLPYQSMIILIIGEDNQPRLPTPDTVVHQGDLVVAVTLRESEGALREELMSPPPPRSF